MSTSPQSPHSPFSARSEAPALPRWRSPGSSPSRDPRTLSPDPKQLNNPAGGGIANAGKPRKLPRGPPPPPPADAGGSSSAGPLSEQRVTSLSEWLNERILELEQDPSSWFFSNRGSNKNWFHFFEGMDSDRSGALDYDHEFTGFVRKRLGVDKKAMPEAQLRALWEALDVDGSNLISVKEFADFMRRGHHSTPKPPPVPKEPPPMPGTEPPPASLAECLELSRVFNDKIEELQNEVRRAATPSPPPSPTQPASLPAPRSHPAGSSATASRALPGSPSSPPPTATGTAASTSKSSSRWFAPRCGSASLSFPRCGCAPSGAT